MRFVGRFSQDEEIPFPMAAMVDVIFLLLIFFVSTSVFYRLEAELDVTIPSSTEAAVSERTAGEIIINVKKDGTIIVHQRELSFEELTDILNQVSELYEGQTVIIRGDAETDHQDIIRVLDACSKANIWNVAFAALTQQEEETTSDAATP
jgi:biopolymer transport protein ExbD